MPRVLDMQAKTIEFAAQDRVDAYEGTARTFFREALDLDFDECLVTDESRLSDFSSCGLPDELAEGAAGLHDLYARWDAWVLPRVRALYGVDLAKTTILLVDLFQRIEDVRAQRVH